MPEPAAATLRALRPREHTLRWAIIATVALLAVTNYLGRGNLSVAAPQIMHDLHISNTMIGAILSAFVWPSPS